MAEEKISILDAAAVLLIVAGGLALGQLIWVWPDMMSAVARFFSH